MECFDTRVRSSVGRIDAVGPAGDADQVINILVSTRWMLAEGLFGVRCPHWSIFLLRPSLLQFCAGFAGGNCVGVRCKWWFPYGSWK